MFDYHLHSAVSFDSTGDALKMAQKAASVGLREICFTDHYDDRFLPSDPPDLFTMEQYGEAYDTLSVPGLTIRRGVEFGLTRWNAPHLTELLGQRPFDFVLGSVHYAAGYDPYEQAYWQGKTTHQAFLDYLEETLRCVQVHDAFDVLGHLTYVCKSAHNPLHEPVAFETYREITDEIMKLLVAKGKGMEVNTSGVDRVGEFLPSAAFLKRFKELGGEIVTVGSDAHDESRVGQYIPESLAMLKEIFGYVCTFEARKPIFHKL